LTFRNDYTTFPPQFGGPKTLRPGTHVPPCLPSVTPLWIRWKNLLFVTCFKWNAPDQNLWLCVLHIRAMCRASSIILQ